VDIYIHHYLCCEVFGGRHEHIAILRCLQIIDLFRMFFTPVQHITSLEQRNNSISHVIKSSMVQSPTPIIIIHLTHNIYHTQTLISHSTMSPFSCPVTKYSSRGPQMPDVILERGAGRRIIGSLFTETHIHDQYTAISTAKTN
jgi:hypothetical protein